MARKRNQKDDHFTIAAEDAINGARNSDRVYTLLGLYGVDEAYLQRGEALLEAARALLAAQARALGEWREATAVFQQMRKEMHQVYMRGLKIARLVFAGEDAAWAGLRLAGPRAQGYAAWHEQVSTFYHNLLGNEAWLARMGQFGFTREQLLAEQEQVTAVANAHHNKEQQRGLSREATKAHRNAMDTLLAWLSEFRTIAKIALDNNSALLTHLGM